MQNPMLKFFLLPHLILQIGLYFSVGISYPRTLRSMTQPEFSQKSFLLKNSMEFFLPPKGTFQTWNSLGCEKKRKNPWFLRQSTRLLDFNLIIFGRRPKKYHFLIQTPFWNTFGTETKNSGVTFLPFVRGPSSRKHRLLSLCKNLGS